MSQVVDIKINHSGLPQKLLRKPHSNPFSSSSDAYLNKQTDRQTSKSLKFIFFTYLSLVILDDYSVDLGKKIWIKLNKIWENE